MDRLEADLRAYTGAKHAVAVVNGTAALHIALMLVGVQMDDEVLVPALTFVATANALAYCGAVPHFVDSEEGSLGIDRLALHAYLQEIADVDRGQCVNRLTGRVIRALVPVHTFSHPADIETLLSVARDFQLTVIEDAAESLGSTVRERHTGTFGLMGTLSFNGNKVVATGGGGAILTNDADLGRRTKHLTTTAKVPHRWELLSRRGRLQLPSSEYQRSPRLCAARAISVVSAFKASPYRALPRGFCRDAARPRLDRASRMSSNYWLQTLLVDASAAGQRDEILEATNDAGFMTRPLGL